MSKIKSNDDKKKEEETYAVMPYLETEEEAAERIADFHEKKGSGHVYLFFCLKYITISSKELITNIEQLIKNSCKNK